MICVDSTPLLWCSLLSLWNRSSHNPHLLFWSHYTTSLSAVERLLKKNVKGRLRTRHIRVKWCKLGYTITKGVLILRYISVERIANGFRKLLLPSISWQIANDFSMFFLVLTCDWQDDCDSIMLQWCKTFKRRSSATNRSSELAHSVSRRPWMHQCPEWHPF